MNKDEQKQYIDSLIANMDKIIREYLDCPRKSIPLYGFDGTGTHCENIQFEQLLHTNKVNLKLENVEDSEWFYKSFSIKYSTNNKNIFKRLFNKIIQQLKYI